MDQCRPKAIATAWAKARRAGGRSGALGCLRPNPFRCYRVRITHEVFQSDLADRLSKRPLGESQDREHDVGDKLGPRLFVSLFPDAGSRISLAVRLLRSLASA
jgi:hypothetical protein